jgi:diguanylate cyclase
MQKHDLKSLVTQMYANLLDKIESNQEVTVEQISEYLMNSATAIAGIDQNKLHSIDEVKALFTDTYKEVAKESLISYQDTNKKFEQIAQMHEKTVNEYTNLINLPILIEQFQEIQLYMNDEVKKANTTIMQLVEKVKELEETSNLDPLTRVYNRRALSSYLDDVCSKKNINYELHLLILDIDDFKLINDTYGHIAGDKILIFLANILKKTLRDGDKIFRYGGEEFIIVLNRIDTLHCKNITNRLLELVRKNKLIYKGQNIHITMSVGASKLKENDTPDSLLGRADKALYKAKNSGKNQMYSEV